MRMIRLALEVGADFQKATGKDYFGDEFVVLPCDNAPVLDHSLQRLREFIRGPAIGVAIDLEPRAVVPLEHRPHEQPDRVPAAQSALCSARTWKARTMSVTPCISAQIPAHTSKV